MKTRAKLGGKVSEFAMVTVADLDAAWRGMPSEDRVLHQCHCAPKNSWHENSCDYMVGLNHQLAVDEARAYLASLGDSDWVSASTLASAVSQTLTEGSPQAELTLSFLTDSIELSSSNTLQNGRHRVVALIDAKIVGTVPVRRV